MKSSIKITVHSLKSFISKHHHRGSCSVGLRGRVGLGGCLCAGVVSAPREIRASLTPLATESQEHVVNVRSLSGGGTTDQLLRAKHQLIRL